MAQYCNSLLDGNRKIPHLFLMARDERDEKGREVGERLRALRKVSAAPTQVAFAETIGVTQGHYSQLEKGDRNLTVPQIRRICARWRVTSDWLLFGDLSWVPREIADRLEAELQRSDDNQETA